MKVLIVEDSGLIRRVISKVAREQGFQTVEAENGAEGLSKLRKLATDIGLIILDWNMPVMDGYEVLTKIKSDETYKHIPVLMATADGVDEDVIKAMRAGADSYLVKPFTEESLSAKIKDVVKKGSRTVRR